MMLRRNLIAAAGLSGLRLSYGANLNTSRYRQSYTGSTIKIGQSAVASGQSARLGQEMKSGMQAAFAMANVNGGVNGRRVELVFMDDGYSPEVCKSNTVKLLDQGVFALSSYVGTPTCLEALPVISDSGIPFVGAFTGASSLRRQSKNVFHTRASYREECRHHAAVLTAAGANTRVGYFIQDDAYGKAIAESMNAALDEYGIRPTVITTVPRNSVNVTEAAQLLLRANCTGLAIGSVYASIGALLQQLGPYGQAMIRGTVSFAGTSGLIDNLGIKARGIGITQVVPHPLRLDSRLQNEYAVAMKSIGVDRSYGSFEGYINGRLVLHALRQAGENLTWKAFIEALEQRIDLDGYVLDFKGGNREGSNFVAETVIDDKGRVLT